MRLTLFQDRRSEDQQSEQRTLNYENSLSGLSATALAFGMFVALGITVSLHGQDVGVGPGWATAGRLSLPMDWRTKHVIYTGNFKGSSPATGAAEQAAKRNYDPRLFHSWLLQGHLPTAKSSSLASSASRASLATAPAKTPPRKSKGPKPHRDWSLSLGNGGVAQNMYPAKFNFDINSPETAANCNNDFVVFGLNVAGTASQANLVGVDDLYSGTNPTGLCGMTPSVKWAYNVTTLSGGKVTTSPTLSIDGTQVAFVESSGTASVLHVLKWLDANGTVTAPVTPAIVTAANY